MVDYHRIFVTNGISCRSQFSCPCDKVFRASIIKFPIDAAKLLILDQRRAKKHVYTHCWLAQICLAINPPQNGWQKKSYTCRIMVMTYNTHLYTINIKCRPIRNKKQASYMARLSNNNKDHETYSSNRRACYFFLIQLVPQKAISVGSLGSLPFF